MPNEIDRLEEAAWNAILCRIARDLPDLYAVAFWLHVSGVEELDDRQVREWFAALVRANAI